MAGKKRIAVRRVDCSSLASMVAYGESYSIAVPAHAAERFVNEASTSSAVPVRSATARKGGALRLAYFVSHPIQYQAPLLRRIAQERDIDLTVFFSSDLSVRGYHDRGFGVRVEWDVPLVDGYRHEFLPRLRDRDTLGFAKPLNYGIFQRLRRGGFDAAWVFGYSRLACLQAIFAARCLGIPVLMRTDSALFDRVRTKSTLLVKSVMLRLLRPWIRTVVSAGSANTDYWKHYLGQDFPVFTMPYAVDNEFYRQGAMEAALQREEFRRELGLDAGRPVILCASKLTRDKGCMDLIEAYIRLSARSGLDPHAYLLVVGDGEERASLEARARASGLSGIHFLGFRNQTELPRFYDLCDVFVLPSHHDAWGLVINEVMNAGRAVVVTDRVGCFPDLIHEGLTGFVYPAGNIGALAGAVERLLGDPALRTSMGENSLRLIQQYSFEQDVAGLRKALAFAVPGFVA